MNVIKFMNRSNESIRVGVLAFIVLVQNTGYVRFCLDWLFCMASENSHPKISQIYCKKNWHF